MPGTPSILDQGLLVVGLVAVLGLAPRGVGDGLWVAPGTEHVIESHEAGRPRNLVA